jgi:hypothetical protein
LEPLVERPCGVTIVQEEAIDLVLDDFDHINLDDALLDAIAVGQEP